MLKKFFIGFLVLGFMGGSVEAHEALSRQLDAHGGLKRWRSFRAFQYDVKNWPHTQKGALNDRQWVDLRSRRTLIVGEDYKLAYDGQEVWVTPDLKALGLPARFYVFTPFYFAGMPFLLADPGTLLEAQGAQTLKGTAYDVFKISYEPGVGDTPDDDYVAYFRQDTGRLEILTYLVTYPLFRQGKSLEELERHAVTFDGWQEVEGLWLPQKVSFHEWKDGGLGAPHGSFELHSMSLKKRPPPADLFQAPAGAAVDRSHQ